MNGSDCRSEPVWRKTVSRGWGAVRAGNRVWGAEHRDWLCKRHSPRAPIRHRVRSLGICGIRMCNVFSDFGDPRIGLDPLFVRIIKQVFPKPMPVQVVSSWIEMMSWSFAYSETSNPVCADRPAADVRDPDRLRQNCSLPHPCHSDRTPSKEN